MGVTDRWFAGSLNLGNGLTISGWSMFPSNNSLENLPLLYNKTLSGCNNPNLLMEALYGIILCETRHFQDQLSSITKSNVSGAIFVVSNPESLKFIYLNCPCVVISSMEAMMVTKFAESSITLLARKFRRTVTHVEEDNAAYDAVVIAPDDFAVEVSQKK